MKNCTEILNDDEISALSRMVKADELRRIYAKYPKQFNSLMPGFRAETLSDEQTYSVIAKDRKDPFVKYVLDVIVNRVMKKFYENMTILQAKGISKKEALIENLAHSSFADNVRIFFKLIDETYSPEEITEAEYSVRLHRITEKYTKKLTDSLSGHEELLAALKDSRTKTEELLAQSEQAAEELHSVLEACRDFENEHDQLETAAQEVLDALETIRLTAQKLADTRKLSEQEHVQKLSELEALYFQEEARRTEYLASLKAANAETQNLSAASEHTAPAESFSEGCTLNDDDTEIHSTWRDALETLDISLRSAGTSREAVNVLSCLLYSACKNRVPVLLAGPNAEDIARAFSAAIFAQSPGVLFCEGSFSGKALEACRKSSSETVIIENPFCREWYYHIIRLISQREKFYILVHPFHEDLQLEPKSIVNYCIPVLTEIFIDSYPDRNYVSGREAPAFQDFSGSRNSEQPYRKLLKQLRIPTLAKNILRDIFSDMQVMSGVERHDIFLLYSLAYVCGETETLRDNLDDDYSLKMFRAFAGDDK